MTESRPRVRDVVVIGCSAGGVEALPRILQQLPLNLDAAVLIVHHMAATGTSYLVNILARSSQLSVEWAEHGARIERRRVIVAPPDFHLLCAAAHVHLTDGARENHARPSIDKLFRSAAAVHGSGVIGVLLTGMLDDGVAGLRAIRDAGGVVIVQDPIDAAFPELPCRALQALVPDRTLPIDAIGAAIVTLVGEPVGVSSTAFGHATTARERSLEVDAALWSAVQALNDRATTLESLAGDAAHVGNGQSAETYASRAREIRQQVNVARDFMLGLRPP